MGPVLHCPIRVLSWCFILVLFLRMGVAATCLKVLRQHLPLNICMFIVPVFAVGISRSCFRYAQLLHPTVLILGGKLTDSPSYVHLCTESYTPTNALLYTIIY